MAKSFLSCSNKSRRSRHSHRQLRCTEARQVSEARPLLSSVIVTIVQRSTANTSSPLCPCHQADIYFRYSCAFRVTRLWLLSDRLSSRCRCTRLRTAGTKGDLTISSCHRSIFLFQLNYAFQCRLWNSINLRVTRSSSLIISTSY